MRVFECKHNTDLYVSKEGVLIMKGDKGVRLDHSDIAMVCVCRWKKLRIITKTHQIYVITFPNIMTLNTAVDMFNENGTQVVILFRGRGT